MSDKAPAATGRILDESPEVYFGPADKPKFGSSAIRMWITDPELFYRIHIARDLNEPEFGRAGIVGNAVEEIALEDRDRTMTAPFKTVCKGVAEMAEANPGKLILTQPEAEEVRMLVDTVVGDPLYVRLHSVKSTQVTYRKDMGPFYVQGRVDFELENDAVPESVFTAWELPSHMARRVLVDLKTCATHYGRNGFAKVAMFQYHYPLQAALYQELVSTVTGLHTDVLPFVFLAVAKDGGGARWYRFLDLDNAAKNRVLGAIGELKHRMETKTWDDFAKATRTVLIPENYLTWSEQQ